MLTRTGNFATGTRVRSVTDTALALLLAPLIMPIVAALSPFFHIETRRDMLSRTRPNASVLKNH